MRKSTLLSSLMLLLTLAPVFSQTGTLKGFVYDAASGQPLPLASITLPGTKMGVVTNSDGFFLMLRVPAGTQTVKTSYMGYEDDLKSVTIVPEGVEQVVVNLRPTVFELDAATINAERRRLETINPVSAHHLTQVTLNKVPGLTGQSDLAEYLQVIPGFIFTGDRGGQFYVRGGEPVQNLVKIDGMTVVSPFHSVGFASVFDTETIGSVDVYTAGFGAKYGGRTSSVIDVKTRIGNRREFKAKASASTFGYGLMAEGPLKKMTDKSPSSISVIISNKGSYIRKTGGSLYPYLDSTGIPFSYSDFFGKVSLVGRRGDQLDLIGMHYSDAADYSGLVRSTWVNNGGGIRFLVSPQASKLLLESTLFYTDYQGQYLEASSRPRNTRYNSLEWMFKMHYNGTIMKFVWGTELNVANTFHSFLGEGDVIKRDEYFATELFSFLDGSINAGKFLIEPGLRLHYYADQAFFSPEPRLKVRYRINGLFNLNVATGLYSQNLVSTSSPADVVNVFQGYYIGPAWVQDTYRGKYIDDKISLAWHAVAGLSYLGPQNLKLSVEGYVKDFYRMINYNRNKAFEIVLNSDIGNDYPEYLTKYFIIEKGWAYGMDFLADWSNRIWNVYLAYSLGYVFRQDEFMDYLPHFDRRHNLNFVGGYKLGKHKNWEVKARWNVGSGFPFTQSYGLYEDIVLRTGGFAIDPLTSGELSIWFAPINEGRLPWYHRLDASIQRVWTLSEYQTLEFSFSIMNLYNRQNVFYVNRITLERVNQLPILPTVGLNWRF